MSPGKYSWWLFSNWSSKLPTSYSSTNPINSNSISTLVYPTLSIVQAPLPWGRVQSPPNRPSLFLPLLYVIVSCVHSSNFFAFWMFTCPLEENSSSLSYRLGFACSISSHLPRFSYFTTFPHSLGSSHVGLLSDPWAHIILPSMLSVLHILSP